MPLSDIAQAQALTGTTLDATILTALQDMADSEIANTLEDNNLVVPTSAASAHRLIKLASTMWTCRNILIRQKADGTSPNAYRTGNYTQENDIDKSIQYFHDAGQAHLEKYLDEQVTYVSLYLA